MYNMANKSPKPNQYGILSSLLPKMIKKSSSMRGGPFILSHPVGQMLKPDCFGIK